MKRFWVRGALALGSLFLITIGSGCLIEGPEKPPPFYSWVRIQPGDRFSGRNLGPLPKEPDGMVYQIWVGDLDQSGQGVENVEPLLRFKWDPENYLAMDEDGNVIPLTTGAGVDVGINVLESDVLLVTLEREGLPPGAVAGFGPIILFDNPNNQGSLERTLYSPLEALERYFGLAQPPFAGYTLVSQSNKALDPNSDWRDGTEPNGIWFAIPETSDRIEVDDEVFYEAYSRTIVPQNDSAFNYTIWINPAFPESSFSNFGRVFRFQEVDLIFIDGVAQHGLNGTTQIRGPQVPLGEEPIIENGETVGYVYHGSNGETCYLRIDHPWLTHCDTDPFESLLFDGDSVVMIDDEIVGYVYYSPDQTEMCELRFDDPSLSKCIDVDSNDIEKEFYPRIFNAVGISNRQGTTTEGDTTVSATMGIAFPGFGFRLEMEAWLVFTKESGIPPMSLGRLGVDTVSSVFQNGGWISTTVRDQSNPYTLSATFDRNFSYPGEDFLTGLENHDPRLSSPLNVVEDERVEKIWVTLEPAQRIWIPPIPQIGQQGMWVDLNLDWAPEAPYEPLIVYSGRVPDTSVFQIVDDTLLPPVTYPLFYRDPDPDTNGVVNGNQWPAMKVHLNNVGP